MKLTGSATANIQLIAIAALLAVTAGKRTSRNCITTAIIVDDGVPLTISGLFNTVLLGLDLLIIKAMIGSDNAVFGFCQENAAVLTRHGLRII